jgi:acetyl/propionyl-CoA carboxylase alpha subunit
MEVELKRKIIKQINYRKPRIPFGLKMIITFVVITTFGITLWLYVGTDNSGVRKNFFSVPFFKREKKEDVAAKTSKKDTNKSVVVNQKANADSVSTQDVASNPSTVSDVFSSDKNISSVNNQPDSSQTFPASDEDKNLIVKKDQLLSSLSISVNDKTSANKNQENNETASLSKDATEKLNSATGVPYEEMNATNYQVEFWISPVNYRGYKMSKNKIVLFGVEEFNDVKLYRVNEDVYLNFDKSFYRLTNSYDFIAYQKLKESEIPVEIK